MLVNGTCYISYQHIPKFLDGELSAAITRTRAISCCFAAGKLTRGWVDMSDNWHTFNTHHFSDNAQGWNRPEQPNPNIARGVSESSSNVFTVPSGHVLAQGTPVPMSSGYPSSIHNVEFPHYQPMVPCPSHDPFLQQSAAGNLPMSQDNYLQYHTSPIISGADNVSYHQASVYGRGTYKRKSPGFYDIGSTSRYHEVGMSPESQLPTVGSWQENPSAESYHENRDYPQNHGDNNFSMDGDYRRNVRSRTTLNLDHNPARTHFSSSSVYHPSPSEQSNPVDRWAQVSGSSTIECAYHCMPPSDNAITAYGADSSYNSHEPRMLNNHRNVSLEIGSYSNIPSMGNPAPPIVNRGVGIGNCQRPAHYFQASSSNIRPGLVQTSGERAISGPSFPLRRDPHPHTTLRFRNLGRNGRITSDRYRSLPEANFHDQHRDMRLDIDNMSYEELLALGERIGSVSTGLSDTQMSKCLIESIHCSSDPPQDEGICVICLEEYKNNDDVGTLKACGHDFHVGCVRKWLSMKNLCPICKMANE